MFGTEQSVTDSISSVPARRVLLLGPTESGKSLLVQRIQEYFGSDHLTGVLEPTVGLSISAVAFDQGGRTSQMGEQTSTSTRILEFFDVGGKQQLGAEARRVFYNNIDVVMLIYPYHNTPLSTILQLCRWCNECVNALFLSSTETSSINSLRMQQESKTVIFVPTAYQEKRTRLHSVESHRLVRLVLKLYSIVQKSRIMNLLHIVHLLCVALISLVLNLLIFGSSGDTFYDIKKSLLFGIARGVSGDRIMSELIDDFKQRTRTTTSVIHAEPVSLTSVEEFKQTSEDLISILSQY